MSEDKAILILDEMPNECWGCPLQTNIEWAGYICVPESYKAGKGQPNLYKQLTNKELNKRPDWCPLRLLPKKWERQPYNSQSRVDWKIGYNDCLDDIQGIKDEQERINRWWAEHSSRFD